MALCIKALYKALYIKALYKTLYKGSVQNSI